MNINEIIKEYNLETNDIRWYLASNMTYKILQFHKDEKELTKYIESGRLEEELYNMEENYILELQDLADRNKLDEVNLREILNEMVILKHKRFAI